MSPILEIFSVKILRTFSVAYLLQFKENECSNTRGIVSEFDEEMYKTMHTKGVFALG